MGRGGGGGGGGGGAISRLTKSHLNVNELADNEFYDYFMNLCYHKVLKILMKNMKTWH